MVLASSTTEAYQVRHLPIVKAQADERGAVVRIYHPIVPFCFSSVNDKPSL